FVLVVAEERILLLRRALLGNFRLLLGCAGGAARQRVAVGVRRRRACGWLGCVGIVRKISSGHIRLLAERSGLPGRAAALALFQRRRLVDRFDDAEIMFRMLQIIFGRHAVAAAGRIAPKRLILLANLPRIAAHAHIQAMAVEGLMPQRRRRT